MRIARQSEAQILLATFFSIEFIQNLCLLFDMRVIASNLCLYSVLNMHSFVYCHNYQLVLSLISFSHVTFLNTFRCVNLVRRAATLISSRWNEKKNIVTQVDKKNCVTISKL